MQWEIPPRHRFTVSRLLLAFFLHAAVDGVELAFVVVIFRRLVFDQLLEGAGFELRGLCRGPD